MKLSQIHSPKELKQCTEAELLEITQEIRKAIIYRASSQGSHIALIGYGTLSGGEAFKALNHIATLQSNCIIIINDNNQSITQNHGGLYTHLKELRDTNGHCQNNMFKAMSFYYRYIEEDNSSSFLITEFKSVKDYPRPIILHIRTTKGFRQKVATYYSQSNINYIN